MITVIPITRGVWSSHSNIEWEGFYFEEFVIDWSLFKNARSKLYVETMHGNQSGKMESGELRMSYQYLPAIQIPIAGSEIKTRQKVTARWQLLESEWFDMPTTGDVACVWIQGKADPNCNISLALATLVILHE